MLLLANIALLRAFVCACTITYFAPNSEILLKIELLLTARKAYPAVKGVRTLAGPARNKAYTLRARFHRPLLCGAHQSLSDTLAAMVGAYRDTHYILHMRCVQHIVITRVDIPDDLHAAFRDKHLVRRAFKKSFKLFASGLLCCAEIENELDSWTREVIPPKRSVQ